MERKITLNKVHLSLALQKGALSCHAGIFIRGDGTTGGAGVINQRRRLCNLTDGG